MFSGNTPPDPLGSLSSRLWVVLFVEATEVYETGNLQYRSKSGSSESYVHLPVIKVRHMVRSIDLKFFNTSLEPPVLDHAFSQALNAF